MQTRLAALPVVFLALIGVGATAGASAVPASHASTTRVVVRPVTKTGHAAANYTVHTERTGSVNCSFAEPSPGAVSRNIEFCSPSVEQAVACWKSAAAHRVLCIRNPGSHNLVRIPRSGKFARTKLAPRVQRAPLLIVLRDGTRCDIRDGGAWSTLKSHPNWVGRYSCDHHGDVWSPATATHNGVNESKPSWTVRTAARTGKGPVTVRPIARAYFVGTATS
jgi:hypothetical protein